MTLEIPLSQGKIALIDDEDYALAIAAFNLASKEAWGEYAYQDTMQ